ncbi:asparagine synthase-related protein [Marinobacterium jannaschii]|uniref:asparagine synthase-related protein n=1 Tax=Marinobacterium jannaschii TaxID=64970 RepID=UPI00048A33CF|nr:asparagine synthase-related protein [Marinobacterium jannaschii]
MSDLLVSGTRFDANNFFPRFSLLGQPDARAFSWDSLDLLSGSNSPRWSEAKDARTGVCVAISGRLAFEQPEWARASGLSIEGGTAAALILERWLADAESVPGWLNGAAVVFIWEPQHAQLSVITDRLGASPVYHYESDAQLLLGTHPDLLADLAQAQGLATELDLDSMAEALATGEVSQPYSYYQSIRQLEAASVYRFSAAGPLLGQRLYWGAELQPEYLSDDHCADRLAESMTQAVRRRMDACEGRTGLLLSGGADSRALLFAARQPSEVETVTFFDSPNAELEVAAALAEAAGARHTPLQRDFDHYGNNALESVRIGGGFWSVKDAHYHGFFQQLSSMNLGLLLTGCYADYLLKGLGFNKSYRRFMGRTVPIQQMADFDPDYYQPYSPLAEHWNAQVRARQIVRIPEQLRHNYADKPWEVEDRRVRPLVREADGMGRLYLARMLPWDPVMADRDIADCYLKMAPEQKLNARVFRKAVLRIVGPEVAAIRNNNDHVALGDSDGARIYQHFRQKVVRRFRQLCAGQPDNPLTTAGSWPDFSAYVARSAVINELWQQPGAQQKELLSDLLGFDPWSRDLSWWARHEQVDLFLRLLTLKLWLGLRGYQ